jgi:hypothetical protein
MNFQWFSGAIGYAWSIGGFDFDARRTKKYFKNFIFFRFIIIFSDRSPSGVSVLFIFNLRPAPASHGCNAILCMS